MPACPVLSVLSSLCPHPSVDRSGIVLASVEKQRHLFNQHGLLREKLIPALYADRIDASFLCSRLRAAWLAALRVLMT